MAEPWKLPILSLKGGTGKTTVCIGLAQALQEIGKKVGLLDVDIHASALPRAIGLEVEPGYESLLGGNLRPIDHNGYQVFSIGLLYPEEDPNMWPGPAKASAVQQIATTSIAWNDDLEWIVVDTPPTSGDEVQSLLENLANIYGCVIVCQPNTLAVLAIAKTVNLLQETGTPIAGIVANMAGYECPHCGKTSNPFDRMVEDIAALAQRFGVAYLGAVPFAGEQIRQPAMRGILDKVLTTRPVTLKKRKGGMGRWVLDKLLKSAA